MYIGAYQGNMQSERAYSEKTEYSEKRENISFKTGGQLFDSAWEKAVIGGLKKPTKQEEDHKQIIKTKCAVYLLEILFRTRHGKLFSDDYFLKEFNKSIEDFTGAILLKKDYENAYYNRANSYYELKEYLYNNDTKGRI